MTKPTIVVNAFNRPGSLRRLLFSLKDADIDKGTSLVFSLEFNADKEVLKQVQEFEWVHGRKEIIIHEKKMGLVGHFLFCGDLTQNYGAIIYLEDDLFVGKTFYKYALTVLKQYGNEERLAGFSLNTLWFNGYTHFPFHPIDDGNPCFFLQVPWYQGQIYTSTQWKKFKDWYDNRQEIGKDLMIHNQFLNYKFDDEWFPVKVRYLIENNKYYCFPRQCQCVNFGDAGTHFVKKTNFFQTELSVGISDSVFSSFDDCIAVYDSFYELLPEKLKKLNPELGKFDLESDLNGTKDISKVKKEYIITSAKPVNFIRSYGFEMRPPELNIVYNIEGDFFYLAKTNSIVNRKPEKATYYKHFFYHYRLKISKKKMLYLLLRYFGRTHT